jgi:hypothetical protein
MYIEMTTLDNIHLEKIAEQEKEIKKTERYNYSLKS